VGERLIPLVRDAVRSIDRDARVIDVDLRFVDG
jgi:ribosomal 30S subunit maturation factor RimM